MCHFFVVFLQSNWVHVDKNGNEIVSAKYYDDDWMIRGIEPFACGLAMVKRNGKYGYINTKGEN